METKLGFVVALEHIQFNGLLHNGIKLTGGLRLINDPSRVPWLKDNEFRQSIGRLELQALQKAKLLVVSEPNEFILEGKFNGQQVTYHLLNIVRSYLLNLWLIRDNCAYFDQGFLFEEDNKLSHSCSHATRFFKADGSLVDTSFTRGELDRFRTSARVYDTIQEAVTEELDYKAGRHVVSAKDVGNYERFLHFIAFARETTDIGLKIAMYCSALETLLSHSSTAELTHKISERVALLIAPVGLERLKVFRDMKVLYSIRSAVVHGTDIAKKQLGNLLDFSKQADEIVRQIAVLYHLDAKFRNAINSDSDAEDFFLKKMFCNE